MGFGIGHNLEKNLKRAQQLRAQGQFDRALRQLQDWAKRHPDTPHYLYEAAQVAFDGGDWGSGLNSLRQLLRNLPDTRDRVLRTVGERYANEPVLPLAEFLIEQGLQDRKFSKIFSIVGSLPAEQRKLYGRKLRQRQSSLEVGAQSGANLVLPNNHLLLAALASAEEDSESFARHAREATELREDFVDACLRECEAQSSRTGEDPWLLLLKGSLHCRQNRSAEGCAALGRAAEELEGERERIREFLNELQPSAEAAGIWCFERAQLARFAGEGTEACALYREAADKDARLRPRLLKVLRRAKPLAEGQSELGKLQLRLQIVQGDHDGLRPLVESLLESGEVAPRELRALLGEGRSDQSRPLDLQLLLAEAALRGHDLPGAAIHIHSLPEHVRDGLEPLRETIEEMLPHWDAADRLEIGALHSVLLARMGDEKASAEAVIQLWENYGDEPDKLMAVTRGVLANLPASVSLFLALLDPLAEAGATELLTEELGRVLKAAEFSRPVDEPVSGEVAPFEIQRSSTMELDLDALGSEDEEADSYIPIELVDGLISCSRSNSESAGRIVQLIEGHQRIHGGVPGLRRASAIAHLRAGKVEAGLNEFSVLLMSNSSLTDEAMTEYEAALKHEPTHTGLHRAAAEIHLEDGDFVAAREHLAKALAESGDADTPDICTLFERMLNLDPGEAEAWSSYANALFAAGRYAVLDGLLERAKESAPESASAALELLSGRVCLLEARPETALAIADRLLRHERLPASELVSFCEELALALPANAHARLLQAHSLLATEDLVGALDACRIGQRLEPQATPRFSAMVEAICKRPAANGKEQLSAARFFLGGEDADRAARAYEHALQLDASLAGEIAAELRPAEREGGTDPLILRVGAKAAELCGDLRGACQRLLSLHGRLGTEAGSAPAALRQLRKDHPTSVEPARTLLSLLCADGLQEAAIDELERLASDGQLPRSQRIELLQKFGRNLPERARLRLAQARLTASAGEAEEAVRQLRRAAALEDFSPAEALPLAEELLAGSAEEPEGLRLELHDWRARLGDIDGALAALPDPNCLDDSGLKAFLHRLDRESTRVDADPDLCLRRASAQELSGDRDSAILSLQRAIECQGNEAPSELNFELARLLQSSGEGEAAAAALSLAESQGGRAARTRFAAWNRQRRSLRVQGLAERLAHSPQDGSLRLELAEAYLAAGEGDRLPTLLLTPPAEDQLRGRRAALLASHWLERGHAALASNALNGIATQELPDQLASLLRWQRARSNELLGRYEEAIAQYESLRDYPRYREAADDRCRQVYSRVLADLAGEDRAVLNRIADPDSTPEVSK